MKALSLPSLPTDMTDYYLMTSHLTALQVGVWTRLRAHLWQHGRLPGSVANLSAIAGITRRAWLKMEPVLADLFDRDEQGGWHDFDLEEQRAAVLEKRARLSSTGAQGARERWKGQLGVIDGGNNIAPSPVNPGMANAMAYAIPEKGATQAKTEAGIMANAMLDLGSPGSIDRSNFLDQKEEIDRSIGARTGAGASAGVADAMPDAIADGAGSRAEMHSSGMASATSVAMATGMANAIPGTAAAVGKAVAIPQRDFLAAVTKACGENVERSALTWPEMQPLRDLVDAGFDFHSEVLVVLSRVPAMKSKLRSFRGGWIRREVEVLHQHREVAPSGPGEGGGRCFVVAGTPEWRAWCDHARGQGKRGFPQIEHDRQKGFWFEAQWPPGADPGAYVGRIEAAE